MVNLKDARFYAILDTGYVARHEWVGKCLDLLRGGADIIQMRAKRESHYERIRLLEEILPLFDDSDIPLVVNDDLPLALRYPKLGLHVGQDDTPALLAREKLGEGRILGLSTHSMAQAQGAIAMGETLNYFAVGPVFATATKPDYTPVGLGLVRSVAALDPPMPFFCIGGISRSNLGLLKENGARRVVAVSDVLCAADTAAAVAPFKSDLK